MQNLASFARWQCAQIQIAINLPLLIPVENRREYLVYVGACADKEEDDEEEGLEVEERRLDSTISISIIASIYRNLNLPCCQPELLVNDNVIRVVYCSRMPVGLLFRYSCGDSRFQPFYKPAVDRSWRESLPKEKLIRR